MPILGGCFYLNPIFPSIVTLLPEFIFKFSVIQRRPFAARGTATLVKIKFPKSNSIFGDLTFAFSLQTRVPTIFQGFCRTPMRLNLPSKLLICWPRGASVLPDKITHAMRAPRQISCHDKKTPINNNSNYIVAVHLSKS